MGRDKALNNKIHYTIISIHSPLWGETGVNAPSPQAMEFQYTLPYGERHREVCQDKRLQISIHSPLWGETALWRSVLLFVAFQYTLPYGERLFQYFEHCPINISIHSPLWGETFFLKISNNFFYFNTLSPMGRDSKNSEKTLFTVNYLYKLNIILCLINKNILSNKLNTQKNTVNILKLAENLIEKKCL